MTAWERLEGILGLIFIRAIGQSYFEGMAVLRAYGTVTSFSARYDMLIAAIEAAIFQRKNDLHKPTIADNEKLQAAKTAKILTRIKSFSARRNEIAHGVVDRHPGDSTIKGLFGRSGFGWVLQPSEYATAKRELTRGGLLINAIQTPRYYYTAAQIDRFTTHFEKLLSDAQAYLQLLTEILAEPLE